MKVAIANEADVEDGKTTQVDFFGRPVLLLRVEEQVRAYANVCLHLGGPLSLSEDGQSLRCAWHGACFDVATGKAACGPARPDSRLMRLPIKVEEGQIFYVYGD